MKKIQIFSLRSIHKMMYKLFILITSTAFLFLLLICSNQPNSENTIISEIDMEEMAQLHLSDFNLLWERSDSLGIDYVFWRGSDSIDIHIKIILSSSAEEAKNTANRILSYIEVHMEEGPHQGVLIGDKFWWWAPINPNILISIVFIRENALFIMSCSISYRELKLLAEKIDNDIIKKESYITFSN